MSSTSLFYEVLVSKQNWSTLDIRNTSQSQGQTRRKGKEDMADIHSLPHGSRPESAIRNNGSDELALERFKLRELAEGWPCYR